VDTSAYNRPFDDQSRPKVFLETQSVIIILQMIQAGVVQVVRSSVLDYENSRNPDPVRRQAMSRYLDLASVKQDVNEMICQRAVVLEQDGIKALDALHIASAEAANSEYFITCDQRLINRSKELTIKVVNPADFVLEVSSYDPS
jgi:predicted nucleic acid-binding protein